MAIYNHQLLQVSEEADELPEMRSRDADKAAVERAAKSLRDPRVAEVVRQDLVIEDGTVAAYRSKVKVSFS